MKKLTVSIILLFTAFISYSQNDVSVGGWDEHLSYRKPISVTAGNGRVYCATTGGFFWSPTSENNPQHLSKINGLSDIEAKIVKFNPYTQKTLIIYKNTNLDIIEPAFNIVNVPDIKNKSLFGNKTINNVYMENQYAYLACGFGVVVLDMNREEVKDLYTLDSAGVTLAVRDIAMDNTYIYASTNGGVYQALKTSNLSNYNSWVRMTGLPYGIYNTLASVNGVLYACLSKKLMTDAYNADEIYQYENGSWSLFSKLPFGFIGMNLRNEDNKLLITTRESIFLYDNQASSLKPFSNNSGNGSFDAYDSEIDNDGVLWVAEQRYGLMKSKDFYNFESLGLDGPHSINIHAMTVRNGELWSVAGGLDAANKNTYTFGGTSIYSNNKWEVVVGHQGSVILDSMFDMVNVIIDPLDPNKAYIATFGHGIMEFRNRRPYTSYSLWNSSLVSAIPGDRHFVRTYGMAFDDDHNLWVTNIGVATPLAVKLANGTWKSINLSGSLNNPYAFQLIIDKNNQKWFTIAQGGGLGVFKGGPNDVSNASNTKIMGVAEGKGHLTSAGVYSIAEDQDGEIWVGTDKGICVFYNSEAVFSGQNFDAKTIKLEQDGNVQLLLETETVQAIAVDDANRKWLGTSGSGVYLMSPDGTKQIYHFEQKNSPLVSNNIKSISIDRQTGDVYFGTDKGIMSFRGAATEGLENFTDVYAYPNPVRDNYTGSIVIKGLVANSIVKITDISGTFVCELTSQGGQAIWDGKSFKGEKVGTGVYMVFCTNQEGSQKIATKIVVIN
jgi:streptogramin lyase